jgi:TetR/AcrR family transcriptional repressor of lmrAB and yxaGH operons
MPRRTDAKQRMLAATVDLLQRQGLNGTGLLQVLAESGAPRGSLYFHFPGGKEQLALEALATARDRIGEWIGRGLDAHDSPAGVISGLFERYARRLEGTDFRFGCPVAAVTLEGATGSEALRAACAGALEAWSDVLASRLDGDRDLAELVLATLEGALVVARARRSGEPLRAAGRRLSRLA